MSRFGHHPEPAMDFAIEVDAIEGMMADYKAGLEKRGALEDRILKAMQFRVGGTVMAVAAKQALRDVETKLKGSLATTNCKEEIKSLCMEIIGLSYESKPDPVKILNRAMTLANVNAVLVREWAAAIAESEEPSGDDDGCSCGKTIAKKIREIKE